MHPLPLVLASPASTGGPFLYRESAATLEAESGYIMETPEVAEFRRCILDASWHSAEDALLRLGVKEGEGLWVRDVPIPRFWKSTDLISPL